MQHLDWLAFATGIVGTALWAHKGIWAKWASVWWLASSLLWLGFAWQHNLVALSLEMGLTVALVGYGVWNWVFRGKDVEAQLPVAESTRSTPAPAPLSGAHAGGRGAEAQPETRVALPAGRARTNP